MNKCMLCILFVLSLFAGVSQADLPPKPKLLFLQPRPDIKTAFIPSPPKVNGKAYALLDSQSGAILAQYNLNKRIEPASLTKMMTLYLAFHALAQGYMHLNDPVHVSQAAWRAPGSRMFLKAGSHTTLALLIQGIIVDSGNDACIALAEHIAGSQKAFVKLMNQTAAQVGMQDSHFMNADGLPDPQHYTTVHDLALLTQALIRHFPHYYHWFKQRYLTYNKIKQSNRNRLLWLRTDVDGLKTGHTDSAGYCLIASAKRGDMRLITVMTGSPSNAARFRASQALLNYGFRFYKTHKIYAAKQPITNAKVWLGRQNHLPLGLQTDWYLTLPTEQFKRLKTELVLQKTLKAPIQQNQICGTLNLQHGKQVVASRPLIALKSVPKGSLWRRMIHHLQLLWH